MFATIERTKVLTGYDVTFEGIEMAQGVLESYLGRVEADFEDASDVAIMERATAYQAAYMKNNFEAVFEHVGAKRIGNTDGGLEFDLSRDAPIIAPMAHIAMRRLSFMGTRSMAVGSIWRGQKEPRSDWKVN